MEFTSCNLCGSRDHRVIWEGRDWAYGCPGSFTMVRCHACGLVYLDPRPGPAEAGAYYPPEYEPYQRTARAFRSPILDWIQRKRLRSRVRAVSRLAAGGSLLDVGCGSGGFLREISRLNRWQASGVEINGAMARFAREQLGLEVRQGTLEEAGFSKDAFDVVTMWDVLEHLHDPGAALTEVRRILKPGGWLLVSTPSAGSLDARLFGRYWIGLDMPRHLYVFSRKTLEAELRKAGLEPKSVFCFYGRYTTFALSLCNWFNARISSRAVQRTMRSVLLFALFRYLTLPYFLVLDALKLGAILTVTAQKCSDPS